MAFGFVGLGKKYKKEAQSYYDNPEQTDSLLNRAFGKADKNRNSLGFSWKKLQLLFELARAWAKGEYKDVSKGTILAVIGAIIYFVSPVDIIPDFLLGLGLVDDAAVLALSWNRITKDLEKFSTWKNTIDSPQQAENPLS
ncbi:methyltransferase type 11 [Neobacillus piezotolerans]|uniref:Methyltransferase type 11 n=1 Tax=Neobacillus piezotolerans TaxID=2259171 RepID=A0A3D8GV47_9BACI|nr:YkvA family protein [Neobacillus piezotolerans]RDU38354.1 methyltransferase type 11 [Neobacillus piezotolerans]